MRLLLRHGSALLLIASLVLGVFLFRSPAAFGQKATHYSDVSEGAWYEKAAATLLVMGALDRGPSQLRPSVLATRAEVVKMLVSVHDEELVYPQQQSFDDVPRDTWFFPYFETSARAGWVRGDGNCYQSFRPCTARPPASINRAEVAALLVRAFDLHYQGLAPAFTDNDRDQWYFDPIQTAADHCILQGDAGTLRVRPGSFMNRAEMVAMFFRASQQLRYGRDCGPSSATVPFISGLTAEDQMTLRVTFSVDATAQAMEEETRYTLQLPSGQGEIDIANAVRINERVVELTLQQQMSSDFAYVLTVVNMEATRGTFFSDSLSFEAPEASQGDIAIVSPQSDTRLRVTFTVDVESDDLSDPARYGLTRTSGGGSIEVDEAIRINSRTVELRLGSSMQQDATYALTVQNMLAQDGFRFSATETFLFDVAVPAGDLTSIEAMSNTRVQLHFTAGLDEQIAEEEARYRILSADGDVIIQQALLVEEDRVELSLGSTLQAQEAYTVEVSGLRTSSGDVFSATGTLVYAPEDVSLSASLSGSQEVPVVITTAGGSGSFVLSSEGLFYDITVRGMSGSSITGSHFHSGSVGANGPVLHGFSLGGGLSASGMWTGLTMEERHLLLTEDVYVNIHTETYPDGEIRGQVLR